MVEQVKKGNQQINTLRNRVWSEIKDEFERETGHKYTELNFGISLTVLNGCIEFKKLRDQPTGFGWDPMTIIVTIADDIC